MSNKNYIIGLILPLIMVNGCLTQREINEADLLGRYSTRNLLDPRDYAHFDLYEDGSFIFKWKGGFSFGETKGLWELYKNKIIFTSEFSSPSLNEPSFQILEKAINNQDSITIKIVDWENQIIPYGTVFLRSINSELFIWGTQIDETGEAILPMVDSTELVISVNLYERVKFPIINQSYNTFIFQLKLDKAQYKFYDKEKWKFNNEKIYKPKSNIFNLYYKKFYFEKENQ